MGAASFLSWRATSDVIQGARRELQISLDATEVFSALKDAETGQRGYTNAIWDEYVGARTIANANPTSCTVCSILPTRRPTPLVGMRLWSPARCLKRNADTSVPATTSIVGPSAGRCRFLAATAGSVLWLGACLDIDDQMRDATKPHRVNEALQLSNADLEQFSYAASHDMQEPLRMIALYTELLRDEYAGQLDDPARSYVAFAVSGAQRMARLFRDLLAHSHVTGVPASQAEHTEAASALGLALDNLEALVRKTGAVTHTGVLAVVRIVPLHLTQSFQNLVSNALKYSGERFPEVRVSAEREQDHWRFSVKDNGIGIEPQHVKQVFGVFKWLHGQEYEGTGIVLAICQLIVERNGGRIWLESTPGCGRRFIFAVRG
jgi:signal transduction histidine kinase